MKRLLVAIFLTLWAVPVSAQAITRLSSAPVSGTMTTNGDVITFPVPAGVGFGSIGVEARGTWTGTVEVQCAASTGGGSFVAINLAPRNSTALVTSFTANGQWSGSIAGCQRVRATATAAMTGTVTITLVGNFTSSLGTFAAATGQALCLAFGGTDKLCASATALTGVVPYLGPDGSASAPSIAFASDPNTGFTWTATTAGSSGIVWFVSDATETIRFAGNSLWIKSDTGRLDFGVGDDAQTAREAADHIFQKRSTNAQRASWANTYTSSTNYTSFSIDWQTTANTAIVGTRTAATGTGRTLRLYAQATNAGAGGGVLELSPTGGVMVSATAPTIASGGCTSPAVTWNNGTAAFLLTIGTSCTGVKTLTLTMPAATNLWACDGHNNTSDAQQQTNYVTFRATSTTAVVMTSYDRVTGLQEDFTASDTYLVKCLGG